MKYFRVVQVGLWNFIRVTEKCLFSSFYILFWQKSFKKVKIHTCESCVVNKNKLEPKYGNISTK